MRLYCMRHGIAADRADPAFADRDGERPLTVDGRERARLALHGVGALGAVVDRIVVSPLLRCTQTAEIAAQILGVPRLSVETHAGLLPGADPTELLAGIRNLRDDGVLIIGHAPDLDDLVAKLVGAAAAVTALKKAGCAVVQLKSGAAAGTLIGVYEPKTLRRLGRVE